VKRLVVVLVLVLMGALAAGVSIRHMAIEEVERRLNSVGLEWTSRTDGFADIQWSDLSGSGVEFSRLTVHAGWPIKVELSSGNIDLMALAQPQPVTNPIRQGAQTSSKSSWQPDWSLVCSDINIQWEGENLLSSMNGPVYPHLDLNNGKTRIHASWSRTGDTLLKGAIDGDLPHPAVHGKGTLSFSLGEPLSFSLDAPEAQLDHSILTDSRLPKTELTARGVWSPKTGEVAVDGQYGDVAWSGIGKTKPGHVSLDFRVPLTPLQAIVDLFGDGIPEAARTKLSGEISLDGHIEGPPWTWRIEPGAKNLAAAGAVPADYLGPIIRWETSGALPKHCSTATRSNNTPPGCDPEDSKIPHMTGPRTPDWVPYDRAGWMPEAVIAAEDIRFRSHDGFDLVAIQEALANAGSDERLRGGSTITQQLAKNLFLDGRRTLLRKLRELLFAMSLEERMTKDAILTLYLNVVEFGPGIWGIKNAADAWFMKSPDQLTVREAAFLASILPAPNMWHRRITATGRAPISRVNGVLDRMRRRGSLSKSEHRRARSESLRIVPPSGNH